MHQESATRWDANIIQGIEAVSTITAATKLIEVKQRKVRRKNNINLKTNPRSNSLWYQAELSKQNMRKKLLYLAFFSYTLETGNKRLTSTAFLTPFPFPSLLSDNWASELPTEGRPWGGGGADEKAVGRHHSQMDQPEYQESGEVRIVEDVVKTSQLDGSTRIPRIRRSKNCWWFIYIHVKMKCCKDITARWINQNTKNQEK